MEHLETARHTLYVPKSLFNKQKWKWSERLETSRPLSGGGEEEDRTPDLCIANAALSQLSYPPARGEELCLSPQFLARESIQPSRICGIAQLRSALCTFSKESFRLPTSQIRQWHAP